MSCREFVSEPQCSEESYNWSKLRKKYLDQELPSQQDHQSEESQKPKKYKKYRKGLSFQEIASLHLKKKNLQEFASSIGYVSTLPIRKQITQHCEKIRISFQGVVSCDSLLRLAKNRVEKMIKNKRIKKNWSEQDIKILIWVISKYVDLHDIKTIENGLNENDWEYIASLIPGVTGKSCMFKWLSLKKNSLAQNGWVEEESLLLDTIVKKYGTQSWCQISQQLYEFNNLPNKIYRCPKQCRQHWNCYLNPNLKKGPWSKQQDVLLLRAVKDLNGLKKWAQIVKLFDGRTENALKNRYNLIIEKELKEIKSGRKKIAQLQLIDRYLDKIFVGQYVSDNKLRPLRKCLKKMQKEKADTYQYYKLKDVQCESQNGQYVPQVDRKRRSNARKQNANEVHQQKRNANILNEQSQMYDEMNYHQQSAQEDNISYQQVHLFPKQQEQIFEEEDQVSNGYEKHSNTVPTSQNPTTQNHGNSDVTAQECINIDMSKVKMIEYRPQLLEKLKIDLTKNKFNLIPCTLDNNNVITSYNANKHNQ